jgi:nitroimidazol reductase NimA-like FMN-containing flavoprotein (pyridoxamine 5'-phosphate oxidase superfamily)
VIVELTKSEIDELMRRQFVGRIGCHAGGATYVVPVIYVWHDDHVYVQSIEGRKIRMMRENPEVCFEVDEYEPGGGWGSVIVQGIYEELEGSCAEEALALLVQRFMRRGGSGERERPSGEGRKPVAFRIRSVEVTGRKVSRPAGARALTRVSLALTRHLATRSGGVRPSSSSSGGTN